MSGRVEIVADRFEIERLAGTGGMGQVFRALDLQTGERVALKLLAQGESADRFLREARLLTELDHPGIVRYVAHGTSATGQAYLAMEWLEGETLGSRLKRERLTDVEAVDVVTRMAEAVGAAHQRGIVHRDIKPGNVILVDGRIDRVKLLDFGIAFVADASAVMTRTGAVLGTAGYMAPEQARGVPGVDARADVFALGCVLFHCLTGKPPFHGDGFIAVLAKLVLEDAPPLSAFRPDLPRELVALVARLLDKNPRGRPVDASAFASELRELEVGSGAVSDAVSSGEEMLTAGEQRLVSVLLSSDVAVGEWGSTALGLHTVRSESSEAPTRTDGPGSSGRVREAREAIVRFGGRLELLRSGSMAVLLTGASGTRADAATDLGVRAARCALALRELFPDAPMTLATGRGIVTAGLPVGEAIDRAAELLASAPPAGGGVAVCGLTAGLLDTRFELAEHGQHVALVRERSTDTARRLMGRPTTIVGRDRELRFLDGMLDECVAEPIARVALVIAPPGFGKSRLRYEFLRRVTGTERARVWMARGDPMSAGSPFGLIAQMTRRVFGVQDGDGADENRARLESWVSERFSPDDRPRLAAFLGELARVPAGRADHQVAAARLDPGLMGDQLRRAFEDVIRHECEREPLLLVLEDLHWGDLPSVNLVDSALRAARDLPLMVLALARPEVEDTFPGLWKQREPAELRLGALTRKASERLVRQMLGAELDPALVARIVDRADGNAFYLEELIRTVAGGESEKLPETVLAMVQSRLESLPEGARRVLRAASVFGGMFWDLGVASLLGHQQEPDEVKDWLTLLAEREIVTLRPQSRFPGTREHLFRHALVREAAHAMLTPEDLERGHRLAGAWLEENGEPDALVLAQHFDLGRQPERAASWCRTAAEEAFTGNDLAAAARAVKRALEIARAEPAEPESLGELLLLEGEILSWLGRHREARDRAEQVMDLVAAGSDAWFAAASVLTVSGNRTGDVLTGRGMARKMIDEGWCDRPGLAALLGACRVATAMLQIGDNELGDALISRVEAWAAEFEGMPAVQARWQASLATRALFRGFSWEYRVRSELAAAACEASGDLRTTAVHRHNAAHACNELGAYELAVDGLRATMRLSASLGVSNVLASAMNNLGAALTRLGQRAEARELLTEAIRVLREQGDRRMEGGAHNHLAELLLAEGDTARAIAEAELAVELLANVPPTRFQAMGTLARALLEAGQLERALEAARRANADLDATGTIADGESQVRLVLIEALRAKGDVKAAARLASAAHDRVKQRASAIDDADMRRCFLERVEANRRLAELARS